MPKFLLLSFLFLASLNLLAQVPDFKLNRTFGNPVFHPADVALDSHQNMLVLDRTTINKLDSTGSLAQAFNLTKYIASGYPESLELDQEDNMYVLLKEGKLLKFNPQGELLFTFGEKGSGAGQFLNPSGLCLDRSGNIYIADTGNNRVQKFDATGKYLMEYKLPAGPSYDPSIYEPAEVRVGNSGTVYILTEEHYIFKYNNNGTFQEKFWITVPDLAGQSYAWGDALVLDESEHIYVSFAEGAFLVRVHKLSPTGQHLKSIGSRSPEAGNIFGHVGLALGRNGDLYVTARRFGDVGALLIFKADGTLKKRLDNEDYFTNITQDDQGNYYGLEAMKNWLVPAIKKYNAFGFKLNTFVFPNMDHWQSGALATDGAANIYCVSSDLAGEKSVIHKFSNEGKTLATFENFGTAEGEEIRFSDLAVDALGIMYLAHPSGGCIRKIGPNGEYLGKIGSPGTGSGQLFRPKAVTVDLGGNIFVADFNGDRVQKFSPAGQLLATFQGANPLSEEVHDHPASVAIDPAGNVFTWNGTESFIRRYDASGKEVGQITSAFGRLVINRQGTKLLVVHETQVREFVSGDFPKENLITGKIYQDANGNCKQDDNEKPIPGIMVRTEPGPNFGITDESGNFSIPVDTGTYGVQVILPQQEPGRSIVLSCPGTSGQAVHISNYGRLIEGFDFGLQVSNAPLLQVSLSSDRRRRCFPNKTIVSYSNTGFATAYGAKVAVQLPEHLVFISASQPHTRDHKGNYLFDIGSLDPNQRGSITLMDSVSCADPNIRNLTVCTKAWITPANTYPSPAHWNKAAISVSGGMAQDAQARFVIRNTGTGNMTDSLFFRVYQDEGLALQERYKLAAQDSLVLRFAPTGQMVRVEVDQPEGHPLKATAGASVEVKHARLAMPSLLMMAYPPDDPEPEFVSSCMPILDSFDPNDKQVVPAGLTSEHYTPTNTPLRYTVRFQNTGNDVAYRVVVVDTLAQELDLSTLQVGAASHPYQMSLTGKVKPVLTFNFNNIMLPDSTSDPVGSNGFVQFSIKPVKGLPEKTMVENFADIFFDYNEPVRTNTTVNRIYDMPPVVNAARQLSLRDIIATPTLTSFLPLQSRAGHVVTLSGSHFSLDKTGNKVFFNNTPATVLEASDTSLVVQVPEGAFSGKITVTTADGSTRSPTDFVIYQPPAITVLSALEGVPGSVVLITGAHFSPLPNQDTVSFNGVAAKVLEASATTLKVEVPAGASLGRIGVKTLGGATESQQDYRVWYPPVISSFSPEKGKVGTTVTLLGGNFAAEAGRNVLQFGNMAATVLEASETRLVVQVPAAAPTDRLRLQTPGGNNSSAALFTFIPAPEIAAFTPAAASAGATVTLLGKYFQADGQADTVWFNHKPAKVLQSTPTTLQVQAPKGVESGTITVAGAGGRAMAEGFQVPRLAPVDAITVYPNPTKAGININWFKANFTVERMEVYNAIGKLVVQKDFKGVANDEQGLVLASFGPGVYTIRLHTSAGLVVKQVVAL